MKTKRQIAIFMMILVVFLPIAFAQTTDLQVTKYSGDYGENGYADPRGDLNIEAKALIDWEDQISNDQLKICMIYDNQSLTCRERGNWLNFDNCIAIENDYYKCTFTTPLDVYDEELNFQIDLYDEDDRLQEYEKKTVVLDMLSPVIKEFTVTPKATLGPVNLAYIVEDYGMHPENTDLCSGVAEIKFTINENPVLTDRELVRGECTKTKGVNYVYTGTEPIVRICAQAVDYVGLESEEVCEDFEIDEGSPVIEDIQIVDYDNMVLTHVKTGDPIDAKVRATVTDESGVKEVSAIIPLTGLANYINRTYKDGNDYYWSTYGEDQKMTVTQGSVGTIRVKAEDNVGNEAQKNFDYNITLDTVPPIKLSESSGATDDQGRPMLTYDMYLTIAFSEKDNLDKPGIGMREKKAYLDLRELQMGSNVQAENCRNVLDDKWECKWRIQPPNFGQDVAAGVHNLFLLRSTQDDLGNRMGADTRIEVTYQEQGPIGPTVIDYIVIPGPQGVGGEAVQGDTVQFKVRSRNFDNAEADFTDIAGPSSKPAEECVHDDITESEICTFEEVVGVSGPAEATINFTFTDAFGDSATTGKEIKIYKLEGVETPNYWWSDIECSPHPIDRETTSQIPQHIVCKVDLGTSHPSIDTVNIVGPTSIYECFGNVSGFVDNIRTINTLSGSREPYLMIDLPARDYYLDNLTFQCPISVYSKDEELQIIHAIPEEQLVDVKLEFYDQPLGEIYKKREAEIKRAIEDTRGPVLDIIRDLGEIMYGAEQVCKWKDIITSAISTITAIVVALGVKQDAVRESPFAPFADAIKIIRSPLCHAEGGMQETWITDLYNIVDTACSVVNCQAQGGKQGWNWGGFEAWVGGAAPWCEDIESWANQIGDLGPAMRAMSGAKDTYAEPGENIRLWSTNMKDNIYQSTLCFCLPGIIRNINKILQIDCKYATCLQKDYKETGETMGYCKSMDHYLKCTHVWGGPLFDLIPTAQFWESISQMIGEFIANPFTIATTILGVNCELYCEKEPSTLHTVCAIARVTSEIGESITSIKAMTERRFEMGMVSGEWCEEMEKWAEEYYPEEEEEEVSDELFE